jgi:hypothetical protein
MSYKNRISGDDSASFRVGVLVWFTCNNFSVPWYIQLMGRKEVQQIKSKKGSLCTSSIYTTTTVRDGIFTVTAATPH